MVSVVGWDIGGAHLKAARAEQGCIVAAVQLPSTLRAGLEALTGAFAQAKARMGAGHRHVVTMTGELADTFASREEGVERLARLAGEQLTGEKSPSAEPVSLYAGRAGFITLDRARAHVSDVASANWHASAALVARHHAEALFVDMGSTTTDIVPIAEHAIAARGYTDAERLASGELVYTGLVRSFVMATADRAPFAGAWTRLIAENFANMADAHRVLGTLPDGVDQMGTADGRAKTPEASRARLARMVGADAAEADADAWAGFAAWLAEAQIRAITDGALLALSGRPLRRDAPVVGAGIGTGVIRELARRIGRRYLDFDALLAVAPEMRETARHCAPAAALALLGSAP
jgi:probable H4MPT-linked C1 transfer pathway protein